MSSAVCLQVIDAAALRIALRANLGDTTTYGICATGQWLVAIDCKDKKYRLSVYSLPGIELVNQALFSDLRGTPRANNAGVVYVPGWGKITMFLISDTGNITVLGNLTAGKQLQGYLSVAVGPQPGQLCVGQWIPPRLYIINIATDSIIHTLEIPAGVEVVGPVAAVANGQILMKDSHANKLYLYRSVSQPATVQTIHWQSAAIVGHNNQFVVGEQQGRRLAVGDSDGNWHSVNALTGTDWIRDIAVWGECVLCLLDHSHIALLCLQ